MVEGERDPNSPDGPERKSLKEEEVLGPPERVGEEEESRERATPPSQWASVNIDGEMVMFQEGQLFRDKGGLMYRASDFDLTDPTRPRIYLVPTDEGETVAFKDVDIQAFLDNGEFELVAGDEKGEAEAPGKDLPDIEKELRGLRPDCQKYWAGVVKETQNLPVSVRIDTKRALALAKFRLIHLEGEIEVSGKTIDLKNYSIFRTVKKNGVQVVRQRDEKGILDNPDYLSATSPADIAKGLGGEWFYTLEKKFEQRKEKELPDIEIIDETDELDRWRSEIEAEEAQGKFEDLGEFEGPEYEEEKKKRDPLYLFFEIRGIDPSEFGLSYKVIVEIVGTDPKDASKRQGKPVEVSNYHDFLKLRSQMTDEQKAACDKRWGDDEGAVWTSPGIFASQKKMWDRLHEGGDLHEHYEWFIKLQAEALAEALPDDYAQAVKEGRIAERPELPLIEEGKLAELMAEAKIKKPAKQQEIRTLIEEIEAASDRLRELYDRQVKLCQRLEELTPGGIDWGNSDAFHDRFGFSPPFGSVLEVVRGGSREGIEKSIAAEKRSSGNRIEEALNSGRFGKVKKKLTERIDSLIGDLGSLDIAGKMNFLLTKATERAKDAQLPTEVLEALGTVGPEDNAEELRGILEEGWWQVIAPLKEVLRNMEGVEPERREKILRDAIDKITRIIKE